MKASALTRACELDWPLSVEQDGYLAFQRSLFFFTHGPRQIVNIPENCQVDGQSVLYFLFPGGTALSDS